MDTPIVTTGAAKLEVPKPARDARPPTAPGKTEAQTGEAAADRAAISARSQAAAARARADDAAESEAEGAPVRLGGVDPAPADQSAAARLSRETSRRIVQQPAAAARAQANSDGASVLAMLQ
jgi:hypothetical protein